MSARERQFEIVTRMIRRTPVAMTLDSFNQVADEIPDTHRFVLGCECGDTIYVTLEQGEEGSWVTQTLNKVRSHIESKHGKQMPED